MKLMQTFLVRRFAALLHVICSELHLPGVPSKMRWKPPKLTLHVVLNKQTDVNNDHLWGMFVAE